MKNVKKYFICLILCLVSLFVFNDNVYAAADCNKYACATCTYKSDYGDFTYDIKSNGDGTVAVKFSSKNVAASNTVDNRVDDSYFKVSNKIECRDIYLSEPDQLSNKIILNYQRPAAMLGTVKLSYDTNSSTNNNKTIITVETPDTNTGDESDTDSESNSKLISCDYSNMLSTCTVDSNGSSVTESCTNGFTLTNNQLIASDFKSDSCPKATLTCNHTNMTCGLAKANPNVNNTVGDGSEYKCEYTGQITGDPLIITKYSNKWKVIYPNGNTEEYETTDVGRNNDFPSRSCEDIFYVVTGELLNNIQIRAVEENTAFTDVTIAGYCRGYGNEVEQFCYKDDCKIDEPLCGYETDGDKNSNCPSELRPIMWFIRRVLINTLRIFIPIILIVMGTIDLVRAMSASDDKGNKEAISRFIRRVLAALMIFFIVTIVTIVMNMFIETDLGEQDDWEACWHEMS